MLGWVVRSACSCAAASAATAVARHDSCVVVVDLVVAVAVTLVFAVASDCCAADLVAAVVARHACLFFFQTSGSRFLYWPHLVGDRTCWLAPSIGGKCQFCWESSGSRKESGRSLPSLVGTVHRLEMLIASGKLGVAKKTVH